MYCPCCEQVVESEEVGTSPDIETGEPVPQHECQVCEYVGDVDEFTPKIASIERAWSGTTIDVYEHDPSTGDVDFVRAKDFYPNGDAPLWTVYLENGGEITFTAANAEVEDELERVLGTEVENA